MTPLVALQQPYMRSITTPNVFFKLLEVEPEQDQEGRPKKIRNKKRYSIQVEYISPRVIKLFKDN